MIQISLDYKAGIFSLHSSGHADQGADTRKGFNLVCAAVTALIKTFELSITALCERKPSQHEEEPGHLKVSWEKIFGEDFNHGGELRENSTKKHTLLVLVRSLQIGLEVINQSYPGNISVRYRLHEFRF